MIAWGKQLSNLSHFDTQKTTTKEDITNLVEGKKKNEEREEKKAQLLGKRHADEGDIREALILAGTQQRQTRDENLAGEKEVQCWHFASSHYNEGVLNRIHCFHARLEKNNNN